MEVRHETPYRLPMSSEVDAPGCSGAKACPISGNACPGPCPYAAVLASMTLGVVVFDLARSRLEFCNRRARSLLALRGVTVGFEELRAIFLPGGSLPPGTVVEPDPLQFGPRIIGYTVYHADGVSWVFLRDITEKKRLEAVAAAVETTNNIGYVFSAVRHEIGNPINSIKVALGVLGANLDRFSLDTIAEYVQRMSTEIGRVERLLRTLRSFSAYERPAVERVDLGAFFGDLLPLIRVETEARGIDLSVDVPRGLAAACDPRALHQVLLNLITNACDALAGREGPRIRIRCRASGAHVVIRVEDNGAGIPAEQRARLFAPFSTTKPSGTGLGLVIARKLLSAMDGTIVLDSAEGVGTTAVVSLSSAEPAEPSSAPASPP